MLSHIITLLSPSSLQLQFQLAMAVAALLSTFTPAQTRKFFFYENPFSRHPILRDIPPRRIFSSAGSRGGLKRLKTRAFQETKESEGVRSSSSSSEEEEATEKYGLEFGLWKVFSSKKGGGEEKEKSKAEQAKQLLAKYGGAYLATSISLSLISFSLCYLLVTAGIDVQALLQQVGISTDETGGKVGTFALAYAAHKAASPIRFPPTVALTPIVATWIGKKTKSDN